MRLPLPVLSATCPICGFPGLHNEPRHADGGASHESCPSCGFEFGYHDDDKGISFKEWRQGWINRGMPWAGIGIPRPPDWNPKAQLENLRQDGE
ncbi:MAG: hypothetical protein EPO55_12395 [Reyranella sp.]|nr:MAG: hypothetical protein EPO55_12395 [Reyranella sp.]